MNKHKLLAALVACLLASVALWIWLGSAHRNSDEAIYRQSVRKLRVALERQQFLRRWLPNSVAKPLVRMMLNRPIEAYNAQKQAFLASGFLTNASITWTNAGASFSNGVMTTPTIQGVEHLLRKAGHKDAFLLTKLAKDYKTRQVTVELVCPSQDVTLLRRALESGYAEAQP